MNYYIELFWPYEPEASGRYLALWYYPEKKKRAEAIKTGDRFLLYETGTHPDYPGWIGNKRIFASATVIGHIEEILSNRVSVVGNRYWNLSVPIRIDVQVSRDRGIEWDVARDILGWKRAATLRSGPIMIDSGHFTTLEQMLVEKAHTGNDNFLDEESNDYRVRTLSEGEKSLELHWRYERDRGAVKDIKKRMLDSSGRLFCSICGFSFEEKYGSLGKEIIDIHHTVPISQLGTKRKSKSDGLVVVCSNCHRIIHSKWPPFPVASIKRLLHRHRSIE